MSTNFTTKSIFVILILAGFILTSCYEEPILEPVKRPYSSVRVGNFSYNQTGFFGNIDQFDLYIDGVLKGTVGINAFTDYFDLPSGNRSFVLLQQNGTDSISFNNGKDFIKNVTVLFNKEVTITSYEEISVVFDGVYAPLVDTLMSFAPYPITDGYVYFFEAPDANNANVVASNLAPNTETQNQVNYSIAFNSVGFDTTVGGNRLEYNKSIGLKLPAGDYTVSVLNDVTLVPNPIEPDYDTIAVIPNIIIAAGMKENLFITGEPRSPVLIKNQLTPLAVRPK